VIEHTRSRQVPGPSLRFAREIVVPGEWRDVQGGTLTIMDSKRAFLEPVEASEVAGKGRHTCRQNQQR
jgi:hypothetical protein